MALVDCLTDAATANSYVTVEAADAWFADRAGFDQWNADLPDAGKEQFLITATGWLDTLTYIGNLADTTQALAWPRIAKNRDGREATATTLPAAVAEATYRLAYTLIDKPDPVSGDSASSGQYKKVELGDLKVEFNTAPGYPSLTNSILDLYPWLTAVLGSWTVGGAQNRTVAVVRG